MDPTEDIGRYEWVLEECRLFEKIKHIDIDDTGLINKL